MSHHRHLRARGRRHRRHTGYRVMAAVLALVGVSVWSAHAASISGLQNFHAGVISAPIPTFNFVDTPGYAAIRSDGSSSPPIANFFAFYPEADVIESVRIYAIRDGMVDESTQLTVLFSDLGSPPYNNPMELDMVALTAGDPTPWLLVNAFRVEFFEGNLANRLGIAFILP